MRVLIEHSGYDLLNVGDVAMLQACVQRVRDRWPEANIEVVCHSAERLGQYCPDTLAVGPTFADRQQLSKLSKRIRLGGEQAYKTVAPLFPLRGVGDHSTQPSRTLRRALARADVVIAAGGGYLCDPWWWHGLGVLTSLRAAQRRRIPTAMLGQGIGPLTHPALRNVAARVLPGLNLLTLREGIYAATFLKGERILPQQTAPLTVGDPVPMRSGAPVWLTGDDALVTQTTLPVCAAEHESAYIGVNVRVSSYSGVGDSVAPVFAEAMWSAAAEHEAGLLALPVSNFPEDADLPAIRRALSSIPRDGVPFLDSSMSSPTELMRAAGRCRAVVTGSYHAAVFALGRGVPVVALSASKYYDVKFAGLQALYPGLVEAVRLDSGLSAQALRAAVARAYTVAKPQRDDGRARTAAMVRAADDAFEKFADQVDAARGLGIAR